MNVWRIGTNWDGVSLRDLFAQYQIAFAGREVQDRMQSVEIGDLVGIGSGLRVIGVGAVAAKTKLSETSLPDHAEFGSDLTALNLDPLIWDDNCGIISAGQTRQFFRDAQLGSDVQAFFLRAVSALRQREMKTKLTNLLERNFQLILTGAPGTGKTHLAREVAAELIGVSSPTEAPKSQLQFVQFHPSYDYSDFVQGLKPVRDTHGGIAFDLQDGIFKRFCDAARSALAEDGSKPKSEKRRFVFIIDEINRADLSRVFGELFFAIEPGYRGETVRTQFDSLDPKRGELCVPENLYIIGTMNDIDRSVESLDFALRRRFAWQAIPADEPCFDRIMDGVFAADEADFATEAKRRYLELNARIGLTETLGESYKIGPAYFRKLRLYKENRESMWQELWSNHLSLLLQEYLRGVPEGVAMLKDLKSAYELAAH